MANNENIPNNDEHKKIEVVTGNGDLNISPVYKHLEVQKPKEKKNTTIVIPEVKNNISHKSSNETEEIESSKEVEENKEAN